MNIAVGFSDGVTRPPGTDGYRAQAHDFKPQWTCRRRQSSLMHLTPSGFLLEDLERPRFKRQARLPKARWRISILSVNGRRLKIDEVNQISLEQPAENIHARNGSCGRVTDVP
jgi:hypothetical protein